MGTIRIRVPLYATQSTISTNADSVSILTRMMMMAGVESKLQNKSGKNDHFEMSDSTSTENVSRRVDTNDVRQERR